MLNTSYSRLFSPLSILNSSINCSTSFRVFLTKLEENLHAQTLNSSKNKDSKPSLLSPTELPELLHLAQKYEIAFEKIPVIFKLIESLDLNFQDSLEIGILLTRNPKNSFVTASSLDKLLEVCMSQSMEMFTTENKRKLLQLEMNLRLNLPGIVSKLDPKSKEFLDFVKNLKIPITQTVFDDKTDFSVAMRQLRNLLKAEFEAPIEPIQVGPYEIHVADASRRIAWIVDGNQNIKSHLKSLGWKVFEVASSEWKLLPDTKQRVNFVRNYLKKHKLLAI
jgi:hypothetical protein